MPGPVRRQPAGARIADETERWLGKPVISINVVTYWHALRSFGIKDQFSGFYEFSKFENELVTVPYLKGGVCKRNP